MSDNLRKDFSDKAKEAITPDSTKSTGEKAKESLTGGADRLAGSAQPDTQKGLGQQAYDKVKDALGGN